jgi:hypothetical protein
MLNPSAKLWIDKYLDLLKSKAIVIQYTKPQKLSDEAYIHLRAVETGFIFGVPAAFLFVKDIGEGAWTETERLKVVYFEFLILVFKLKYPHEVENDLFIEKLNDFYSSGKSESAPKWLTFFQSKGSVKTEETINNRVRIRKKIDQNLWVSYMNNSLVFLDIVLFKLFLEDQLDNIDEKRKDLAINVLQLISFTVHENAHLSKSSQNIFDVFLASADLEGEEKAIAKYVVSGSLNELNLAHFVKGLFKRFLVDICLITLWSNSPDEEDNSIFLKRVANHLCLTKATVEECVNLVESFVVNHENSVPFLSSKKSYEKAVGNLSKRWFKVLDRNKDKLAKELQESKELVFLIKKSATKELSAEEKERLKEQFLDIVKSMPALAIFMLPGGALLLPIVLKIIPDLIPSAFRDNEIEAD